MKETRLGVSSPPRWRRYVKREAVSAAEKMAKRIELNKRARRDFIWVALMVVVATAASVPFDLFEILYSYSRIGEFAELDEMVFPLAAAAIGLGWFSWRRWREARSEADEKKRVAAQMRRRAENLNFLISAAPGIFYIRRPKNDWSLDFVSPNVESLMGYQASEFAVAFGSPDSPVHPEDRHRIAKDLASATQHDFDIQEYRIRHKNGAYRTFRDIAQLFRDTKGRPLRITGFLQDITDGKRAEEALRAAKEEAERANAAKSRFLAAASHDLRQPLQAIRLLLSLLSRELVEEKQVELSQDMTRAVGVMDDLLDGVLDISKLEAGIVTPEMEDFHCDGLISGIYSTFRSQAANGGSNCASCRAAR